MLIASVVVYLLVTIAIGLNTIAATTFT